MNTPNHSRYLCCTSSSELLEKSKATDFRCVVIADQHLATEERAAISSWLIETGCLYMMAWGEEAKAWQDAVNLANLEAWNFATIPDERLVISTNHERESLEEVFWYAKHTAMHPCAKLANILLLHIAADNDEEHLLAQYEAA